MNYRDRSLTGMFSFAIYLVILLAFPIVTLFKVYELYKQLKLKLKKEVKKKMNVYGGGSGH